MANQEVGTNLIYRMLRKIQQQVGRTSVHVFDCGYVRQEMIEWLFHFTQDFIIRWKKNHLLMNTQA